MRIENHPGAIAWAVGIYFSAIAALSLIRPKGASSPFLQLFRSFFPSWRFFDDLGDVPTLWIQWKPKASSTEFESLPWIQCKLSVQRSPLQLFHHPRGNLSLALGSHLQALVSELDDLSEPHASAEALPSYRITHSLAEYFLLQELQAPPSSLYRFKITLHSHDSSSDIPHEFLISPIYTLSL